VTLSKEEVTKRSVDSLQKLYAVIVALAIGEAIQRFLEPLKTGAGSQALAWFAFTAFLVTIVPFFHGMNRHLDHCYLEKGADLKRGAILFDFAIFFVEASVLFGVAWSIPYGSLPFTLLGALLAVDMAWGWVSHFIHYAGQRPSIARWSAINFAALLVALFVLFYPSQSQLLMLMVVAIARTIVDYALCWNFYFPPEGERA
jgi:hypothetical protein